MTKDCYTITFGDRAENNYGMQIIGSNAIEGFSDKELARIKNNLENTYNCVCIHYDLKLILKKYISASSYNSIPETSILLIKNFVTNVLNNNNTSNDIYKELSQINCDKKYWSYGRVVNKIARHNLCFSDFDQVADYENKRGTVINFKSVPILNTIRDKLPDYFGGKANSLQAELNHYYDITKCGIGYHGDTERKIVIGMRIGNTIPLTFTWFHNQRRVIDKIMVIDNIENGDLYIMSDYAVGNNWKKKQLYTIRHAAGADKYILPDYD